MSASILASRLAWVSGTNFFSDLGGRGLFSRLFSVAVGTSFALKHVVPSAILVRRAKFSVLDYHADPLASI